MLYRNFALGVLIALPLAAAHASGWKLTYLFTFKGHDGAEPLGTLIADARGNLYGTTLIGGPAYGGTMSPACDPGGCGTVFKLLRPAAGSTKWKEIVLHDFTMTDGKFPVGGLVADPAGNLYGTTEFGGVATACPPEYQNGCGTVFKLTRPATGRTAWTLQVLVNFDNVNGSFPRGTLIADAKGNLYGTTQTGGTTTAAACSPFGCGTVYKVSPPAAGQTAWTETVLHSFSFTDGAVPSNGLIADAAGNLYGTTNTGGTASTCTNTTGCGTVFKLTPPAAGQTAWTETVLAYFDGANGRFPFGGLLADAAGDLFGTSSGGGMTGCSFGCGNVFELTPPAAGQTAWAENVLLTFNDKDGGQPDASLIADGAGNLYGTTELGGVFSSGYGTVFKLAPPKLGKSAWIETSLKSFNYNNGNDPNGTLIMDRAGNLFGTTPGGGPRAENGTVFELSPK